MTRIILEGGTDVAEMVLFSVDGLPLSAADDQTLSELVKTNRAVRMPTGADGAYLLHVYVDAEIPDSVRKYCVIDDQIESKLHFETGRAAFGGAESTYSEFEPNPNIRMDCEIPPGVYDSVTYRTEYPDELIEREVEKSIGSDGLKVVNFPGYIVTGSVILTILLLIVGFSVNATALGGAVAVVVGGVLWFKSYTNRDEYKRLNKDKLEVERQFPTIVVQINSSEDSRS